MSTVGQSQDQDPGCPSPTSLGQAVPAPAGALGDFLPELPDWAGRPREAWWGWGRGVGRLQTGLGRAGFPVAAGGPPPLSSGVTEECSNSLDKGSFVCRLQRGWGGWRAAPSQERVTPALLAGPGPPCFWLCTGNTDALWTPTSSALTFLHFLSGASSSPFSWPQSPHPGNGNRGL